MQAAQLPADHPLAARQSQRAQTGAYGAYASAVQAEREREKRASKQIELQERAQARNSKVAARNSKGGPGPDFDFAQLVNGGRGRHTMEATFGNDGPTHQVGNSRAMRKFRHHQAMDASAAGRRAESSRLEEVVGRAYGTKDPYFVQAVLDQYKAEHPSAGEKEEETQKRVLISVLAWIMQVIGMLFIFLAILTGTYAGNGFCCGDSWTPLRDQETREDVSLSEWRGMTDRQKDVAMNMCFADGADVEGGPGFTITYWDAFWLGYSQERRGWRDTSGAIPEIPGSSGPTGNYASDMYQEEYVTENYYQPSANFFGLGPQSVTETGEEEKQYAVFQTNTRRVRTCYEANTATLGYALTGGIFVVLACLVIGCCCFGNGYSKKARQRGGACYYSPTDLCCCCCWPSRVAYEEEEPDARDAGCCGVCCFRMCHDCYADIQPCWGRRKRDPNPNRRALGWGGDQLPGQGERAVARVDAWYGVNGGEEAANGVPPSPLGDANNGSESVTSRTSGRAASERSDQEQQQDAAARATLPYAAVGVYDAKNGCSMNATVAAGKGAGKGAGKEGRRGSKQAQTQTAGGPPTNSVRGYAYGLGNPGRRSVAAAGCRDLDASTAAPAARPSAGGYAARAARRGSKEVYGYANRRGSKESVALDEEWPARQAARMGQTQQAIGAERAVRTQDRAWALRDARAASSAM